MVRLRSDIPLDEHEDAQALLPWYVTGALEAEEHARVDAHVSACKVCQAEVAFQRRLETEVARLPIDVEEGWRRLRRRVEAEDVSPVRRLARLAQGRLAWAGWAAAASVILAVGVAVAPPSGKTVEPVYHALGAAPAPAGADVAVIFRPDATEAQMRAALQAAHARISDGPTATGAWILAVPAAERDSALAALRARSEVSLAEPLGGAARP